MLLAWRPRVLSYRVGRGDMPLHSLTLFPWETAFANKTRAAMAWAVSTQTGITVCSCKQWDLGIICYSTVCSRTLANVSLVVVAVQSLSLCDPRAYSPTGFYALARTLEWVVMAFSVHTPELIKLYFEFLQSFVWEFCLNFIHTPTPTNGVFI